MLGRPAVCLTQQGYRFIVILALRVMPEPGAADNVCGGDPGVNAQHDEYVGVPRSPACLICNQIRGV